MNADPGQLAPEAGKCITTACGGQVLLEKDTARALHGGAWVFFCLPCCQEDFERDPLASCLAYENGSKGKE